MHVHVKLLGQQLTIWVNNSKNPAVDENLPFQLTRFGRVGFGTAFNEEVHFDNFSVAKAKKSREGASGNR